MSQTEMLYPTREMLDLFCDIADQAGQEIMAVYKTDFAAWSKDDESPLTEADLRADAKIQECLKRAFPQIYILSEESSVVQHLPHECYFLVDPLDGTKEFLKRNDEFTVNIALIARGVAVAGVVFAPALNEMYFAAQGIGAWKRVRDVEQRIQVAPFDDTLPLRVIGSRSHGGAELADWLARLERSHSFVAAGSSLKFCRVAEGAADVYPRFGPTSQWDTAAGQSVVEVAGGKVYTLNGGPLTYGLNRPLLNPEFVACGSTLHIDW